MEDKRFAHIAKDPKFRRIPKAQSKVKIDKRFQSMFTDKKFQVKYTTDKRGRPVKHHSNEDLKRYYELSSESDEESESSEDEAVAGRFVKAPESEKTSESEAEEEKDTLPANKLTVKDASDKKLPDTIKEKLRDLNIDYARGERSLYSDSSSDDEETDDEVSESEEIDHQWGELDADAGQTEEATCRLAACNLDWDRIRALDLMVLFNSFLPPGGVIQSVVIYPSEFGKQRLKEEEIKGPIELVESKEEVQPENETEEGSKYHMEKLRQYQLNRLKYYYAVITFDSANSANKIYTECDGMEYESSATKMDLRFIPDDMIFEDAPKESCDKLPDKYEPRFFTTTALQQAKVELTWDETDPDRLEFAEKVNSGKIDDVAAHDFHNYLAGSSDEDADDKSEDGSVSDNSQPGNVIDKYKALLQDIQEKEQEKSDKDLGMEISWGMSLKEKTDQLVKDKMNNSEEKAPFQKYLDKRKEKRKERKELKRKSNDEDHSEDSDMPSDIDMNDPYFAEEFNNPEFKKKANKKKNSNETKEDGEADKQKQAELDLLLMNGEDKERKHFDMKKIQDEESEGKSKKKKRNKKQFDKKEKPEEDEFKVNVEDQRFSAIFTSHNFNIDPTDPHYKKTKGMDMLIEEKIKRRTNRDSEYDGEVKKRKQERNQAKKKDVKLNMLVKNVQRNAQKRK